MILLSSFNAYTNMCEYFLRVYHKWLYTNIQNSYNSIIIFYEKNSCFLDVKNITQLDKHGLTQNKKIHGIGKFNLYAGLCLMTNSCNKFRFLYFNGQDYRRFVYTLEAAYGMKLPF